MTTYKLPEPVAHMYPDDLERFQEHETFAHAYSVKVGSPDGVSVPLFDSDQMQEAYQAGRESVIQSTEQE